MTHEIFVPQHVSVCTPGVRMLALFAACNDDGTVEHEVLPVVALRSTLGALYTSDEGTPKAPPLGASPAEMRENGWRFVTTESREEPLVLNTDAYVMPVREHMSVRAAAKRVIAAPWPWDEDERRLKVFADDMESLARQEEVDFQKACETDAPYQELYSRYFGASESRYLTSDGAVPRARAMRDVQERVIAVATNAGL